MILAAQYAFSRGMFCHDLGAAMFKSLLPSARVFALAASSATTRFWLAGAMWIWRHAYMHAWFWIMIGSKREPCNIAAIALDRV